MIFFIVSRFAPAEKRCRPPAALKTFLFRGAFAGRGVIHPVNGTFYLLHSVQTTKENAAVPECAAGLFLSACVQRKGLLEWIRKNTHCRLFPSARAAKRSCPRSCLTPGRKRKRSGRCWSGSPLRSGSGTGSFCAPNTASWSGPMRRTSPENVRTHDIPLPKKKKK